MDGQRSTSATACRRPVAVRLTCRVAEHGRRVGGVADHRCHMGTHRCAELLGLPADGVRRRGSVVLVVKVRVVLVVELRALHGQRVGGRVELGRQCRHWLAVEHAADPVGVDGPVPPAHEQRRDGVADEVDHGAALGHELVDAEDQHDGSGRDRPESAQGGGEGDEPAAGDSGRTLRGQDHDGHEPELLAQCQVGAGGLGEVDRGQRQVDRGAVEVEAVAGGDDEPDDAALHTGVLELAHQAGQRGLGRRRPDDQQQLLLEVAQQLEDVELQERHNRAQDHDHEQRGGRVEQADERAEARAASRCRSGRSHTPWPRTRQAGRAS